MNKIAGQTGWQLFQKMYNSECKTKKQWETTLFPKNNYGDVHFTDIKKYALKNSENLHLEKT